MLIMNARPPIAAYAPPQAAPTAALDKFQSQSPDGLADIRALAALARAGRPNPPELPLDLANVVSGELGKEAITSMADERVGTMTGYYVEGLETPLNDPAGFLGKGWTQEERPTFPLFTPYTFVLQGETVTQTLSFDQKLGTTTLHTTHCPSMISTRHHEIVQSRDGSVEISDEEVC